MKDTMSVRRTENSTRTDDTLEALRGRRFRHPVIAFFALKESCHFHSLLTLRSELVEVFDAALGDDF